MDEMLEFAKECGPNVGLLLDSWHWHHAGATPKDIVGAGRQLQKIVMCVVHVRLLSGSKSDGAATPDPQQQPCHRHGPPVGNAPTV